MGEGKEFIKQFILRHPKRIKRAAIVIIFGIVLGVMALSASFYFLTVDDGTYKEDDWSSTPYGAEQYTNGVSANSEGNLEVSMTAQELWDKMLENKSRVKEYLDTPEELARLMKAEIVTQYPDTRPNPDEEINWEEIIANPDKLQGIIKFKRADDNNNKSTMIYADPETFQGYIDEYNKTGSETAKQNALSHFTLKKSTTTVNSNKTENKSENQDKDKKEEKKEKKNKKETAQPATITQVTGDGYSQEYTSSAGITYKHYKQGKSAGGTYAGNSYWDGTISSSGCGPTAVAILASGLTNLDYNPGDIAQEMDSKYGQTSYETLHQEMDSLGMTSQVIQSPSAEIILDNLRNGKVMLVSVNAATRFTSNKHIMAIVDINSDGQIYICNPSGSGEGWYDVSAITNGCNYIVVTEAGATGIAPTTTGNSNYTAVVATWKQSNTTITSNDPNVETTPESQYSMISTNINYEAMVKPYTMPFDLLWALLVVGEDKDFIFELTDLIYHSDIELTIYDDLTENTSVDEWNYTKRTKAVVNANITANCEGNKATGSISNDEHDPDKEETYTTTKTIVTKTNTIHSAITRANVWVVDYRNEYTYNSPEQATTSNTVTHDDETYPDSPNDTGDSYSCEHIDNKKEQLKNQVIAKAFKDEEQTSEKEDNDSSNNNNKKTEATSKKVTYDETINVDYYSKYVNISDRITNTTNTQKYVEGVPSLVEKTDKNTAPNFVTIFKKNQYLDNKHKTKDASGWLFEIIENNETISDKLDLIKYLLQKATGENYYGKDEFDFNMFYPGKLTSLGAGIYGGNLEEKVWFSLRNLGYSEYAVAGVMGNMYGESGFNPSIVEYGKDEYKYGIGLCQWSFGRNAQLRAYAASKGKEWTDEDIQIEFLIAELSREGDAVPFTENQISGTYRTNWENATTVEEATLNFCLGFERCSTKAYYDSKDKRVNAALGYYAQFQGKTWQGSASAVVKEARGALGVPYVWGGESYTSGMDCSGLVKVCYQRALNVSLPHKAAALMTDSHFTTVQSVEELTPGDIIVTPTHVGIYTGEGTVIHEPQTGDVCKEVSLESFIKGRTNLLYRHYNQ